MSHYFTLLLCTCFYLLGAATRTTVAILRPKESNGPHFCRLCQNNTDFVGRTKSLMMFCATGAVSPQAPPHDGASWTKSTDALRALTKEEEEMEENFLEDLFLRHVCKFIMTPGVVGCRFASHGYVPWLPQERRGRWVVVNAH